VKESTIGWTDYSGGALNVVSGCTSVSEGCANCYARAIYERFGLDHSKVRTHPDRLARLAMMRFGRPIQDAQGNVEHVSLKHEGHKPMAFLCDTGDLFHEGVPASFIVDTFLMMADRDDVTWQVLTKRPGRMRSIVERVLGGTDPLPNVWLGVTAENQRTADERIPLLLDTPAAVRFVSVEPMLGPVDLRHHLWQWRGERYLVSHDMAMDAGDMRMEGMVLDCGPQGEWEPDGRLSWVICGAESGPQRRPFEVAWAVDLYEQCKAAGVPYFSKQDSGLRPGVPLVLPGYGVVREWPA
jgi:protein gp37